MASSAPTRIAFVGGGAAGFFAAITCAEKLRGASLVTLLERGPQFLAKVKISGGGRCNVTHACFEPRAFAERYPRGERALIGALHRFQAADTVRWFESRGVKLKTEADGRMFPITDNSQTVIDCLLRAATDTGVILQTQRGVEHVTRRAEDGFELMLNTGEIILCDKLLLATGGCRAAAGGALAVSLGHTLVSPVPSLFTFHVTDARLTGLAGVAVERATVSVPGTKLSETGPVLVTHWGLSGPAILRLSAWGARELHKTNYQFPLRVNWLPDENLESAVKLSQAQREKFAARKIWNTPPAALPARLWERFASAAGIDSEARWATLTRAATHALARQLVESEFHVTGKSLNKDEFVTCGGVKLNEVDFRTMGSRVCPGLFFAGELLDIDGITGGFNFQAAWTTGWIAGHAMAGLPIASEP